MLRLPHERPVKNGISWNGEPRCRARGISTLWLTTQNVGYVGWVRMKRTPLCIHILRMISRILIKLKKASVSIMGERWVWGVEGLSLSVKRRQANNNYVCQFIAQQTTLITVVSFCDPETTPGKWGIRSTGYSQQAYGARDGSHLWNVST